MSDLREKIRLISGTLPTTYIDRIISECMDEAIAAVRNNHIGENPNGMMAFGANEAINVIEKLK